MPIDKELQTSIKSWNNLIKNNQKGLSNLSDLDISALSSWVQDCFEGFEEIYFKLLKEIEKPNPKDPDFIHDRVVDIGLELDHIKNHIVDSEKGFLELVRLLEKKAEEKEK